MPEPVAVGIGIFAFQSIGQITRAVASGQVLFMQAFDPLQVFLERGDEAIREHGDPIFFPFAIADSDRLVCNVNVFHPQPDAFHQAQAGTVEQLGHQAVGAGHLGDDPAHLFPGEDGGQAFGLLGAQGVNGSQVLVKHLAVEEEEGAERLILGGGGDVLRHRQVGQEGLDFRSAHLGGMALVLEEDIAPDPIDVGFFRANGIVF